MPPLRLRRDSRRDPARQMVFHRLQVVENGLRPLPAELVVFSDERHVMLSGSFQELAGQLVSCSQITRRQQGISRLASQGMPEAVANSAAPPGCTVETRLPLSVLGLIASPVPDRLGRPGVEGKRR